MVLLLSFIMCHGCVVIVQVSVTWEEGPSLSNFHSMPASSVISVSSAFDIINNKLPGFAVDMKICSTLKNHV